MFTLQRCSPTTIRNQAVGTCSLVARIGGITSLLLDLLKVYWLPAPVFIMGVVAIIAGAVAVFIPETLGQKLPDTMEDALRFRCFAKFIDFKFPHQGRRKQQQRVLYFHLHFSEGFIQ